MRVPNLDHKLQKWNCQGIFARRRRASERSMSVRCPAPAPDDARAKHDGGGARSPLQLGERRGRAHRQAHANGIRGAHAQGAAHMRAVAIDDAKTPTISARRSIESLHTRPFLLELYNMYMHMCMCMHMHMYM